MNHRSVPIITAGDYSKNQKLVLYSSSHRKSNNFFNDYSKYSKVRSVLQNHFRKYIKQSYIHEICLHHITSVGGSSNI